jgi:DNA-directed RNA polymerase specialized sigma24 family protein
MFKTQTRVSVSVSEHLRDMEGFCARWKGTVFAFCKMLLGDEGAAEAVTLETFLSYLREGELRKSEPGFPSRLFTLALSASEKYPSGSPQIPEGGSQLERALRGLPRKERAVVIMRNLLHFDWARLTQVIGVPQTEAHEIWRRGIFQLNDLLQRDS